MDYKDLFGAKLKEATYSSSELDSLIETFKVRKKAAIYAEVRAKEEIRKNKIRENEIAGKAILERIKAKDGLEETNKSPAWNGQGILREIRGTETGELCYGLELRASSREIYADGLKVEMKIVILILKDRVPSWEEQTYTIIFLDSDITDGYEVIRTYRKEPFARIDPQWLVNVLIQTIVRRMTTQCTSNNLDLKARYTARMNMEKTISVVQLREEGATVHSQPFDRVEIIERKREVFYHFFDSVSPFTDRDIEELIDLENKIE